MATFGNTATGEDSLSLDDDVVGTWADSPASDGEATKLSVYQRLWGADDYMYGALYDAADDTLVAVTNIVTGPQDYTTWVDLPFAAPVAILAAKSYYCTVWIPSASGGINCYYTGPGGSQDHPYQLNGSFGAFPSPVTTSNTARKYSIYCTYTPGSILSLAGTVTGTSSVTGSIGANPVTVPSLAGTIAGTSSITGAIGANPVTVPSLAGTIAGISTITGALLTGLRYFLSGIIAGTSSISGSLVLKTVEELQYFPSTRPGDYDPDLVFDEDTGTWGSDADLLHAGGSRHRQQLVVATTYFIYYEELT